MAAYVEYCRECHDELPYGAVIPEAEFILWGKFFAPEALGPKCYQHASKYIPMHQADSWAVYRLAPVKIFAQALWDIYGALGFDRDGDPTPAAAIAGQGAEGFAHMVLRAAHEYRQDMESEDPRASREWRELVKLSAELGATLGGWQNALDAYTKKFPKEN